MLFPFPKKAWPVKLCNGQMINKILYGQLWYHFDFRLVWERKRITILIKRQYPCLSLYQKQSKKAFNGCLGRMCTVLNSGMLNINIPTPQSPNYNHESINQNIVQWPNWGCSIKLSLYRIYLRHSCLYSFIKYFLNLFFIFKKEKNKLKHIVDSKFKHGKQLAMLLEQPVLEPAIII